MNIMREVRCGTATASCVVRAPYSGRVARRIFTVPHGQVVLNLPDPEAQHER